MITNHRIEWDAHLTGKFLESKVVLIDIPSQVTQYQCSHLLVGISVHGLLCIREQLVHHALYIMIRIELNIGHDHHGKLVGISLHGQ